MAESGRNSGGDLFDMAEKGTTVPSDAAEPRYIKSVPRPDQVASGSDPNDLGAATLHDAATNASDIPRTNRDTAPGEILTGTGDALPNQVDSKRLHNVPGGVTHDDNAKGSTRYTAHIAQPTDRDLGASSGPYVEKAPGDEELSDQAATDKIEKKE